MQTDSEAAIPIANKLEGFVLDFLPILMEIKKCLCLVVGDGDVAYRKASVSLDAGAMVRAVAPDFLEAFSNLARIERIAQR